MATKQAYIGWNTVLTADSVAVDSEQDLYPAELMLEPATNLQWRSDSTDVQYVTMVLGGYADVDYIGIAGHNFGSTAISVEVQVQQNDGDDYETIVDGWTPDDDKPIMKRLTGSVEPFTTEDDGYITGSVAASYDAGLITDPVTSYDDLGDISIRWFRMRLKLTPRNTAPRISVLYAGKSMPLERGIYVGHTPITYSRSVSTVNGMSESGQFLGRIVRATTYDTQVKLKNLTPEWCRGEFEAFIQHAISTPFFFAWRTLEYPLEAGLCWLSNDVPVPENSGPRNLMSVSFKIGGLA